MTPEQIRAVGPDFSNYLQQFDLCCGCPQTFRLLSVYCHGLLSDLDRKSAEPIALASGVAVRTLQEFLRDHLWSFRQARDLLHQDLVAFVPQQVADDLGTVGIVDETSVVKKGTKTPGVQRQWCGAVGKKENCIVTVHLAVARGDFKTLVDAELYLPQSWSDDRERCREADIPDELVYQPKWKIALRQVLRAGAVGFDLKWLTFDEGYGSKPGFLDGLDALGMSYVGEVPRSFACFTRSPSGDEGGHRADDLVRHSPVFHEQSWQEVTLFASDTGPADVGGQDGSGLGASCRPDGVHPTPSVGGVERPDRRREVFHLRRPRSGSDGTSAGGFHAVQRGTQFAHSQIGVGVQSLRRPELHGVDEAHDVVPGDARVRGQGGGELSGGKMRR